MDKQIYDLVGVLIDEEITRLQDEDDCTLNYEITIDASGDNQEKRFLFLYGDIAYRAYAILMANVYADPSYENGTTVTVYDIMFNQTLREWVKEALEDDDDG